MNGNWGNATPQRAVYVALIGVAGLLSNSQATAAPINGWSLQVDPMYMEVFGNDIHAVDITGTTFGPPEQSSTEGVDLEMDGDFAIRGEIRYMANQWGFGANGFWFNPDGDIDRVVTLGAFDEVDLTFPQDLLGGATLPLDGDQAVLRGDNDLEVWSADFYGIRTLAEKPASNIHMLAGLKIGGLETDFRGRGELGTTAAGVFTVTDRATSDAWSDTNTLVGPLIGVAADATYGRHRVKGLLQQSMLFGDVDLSHRLVTDFGADGVTDEVAIFRKTEDVGIPVTELQVKYLYDVTPDVSLGFGGFGSVWWDAPVAPGTDLSASIFGQAHEETLVFLGAMGSIEARWQ